MTLEWMYNTSETYLEGSQISASLGILKRDSVLTHTIPLL